MLACGCLMGHSSFCGTAFGVHRYRSIRTATSWRCASAAQRRHYPEEDPLLRVPRQQPIQKATARPHDLARQTHEGVDERLELQTQHPGLLLVVTCLPA